MKNKKSLTFILLLLLGLSACKNANPLKPSFKFWQRAETATMVQSEMELIVSFDESKQAFIGTLENLASTVAKRARVEVHTFDSNRNAMFEYGPTTPVDLQPGAKINILLPAPTAGTFVTFSMHPEKG